MVGELNFHEFSIYFLGAEKHLVLEALNLVLEILSPQNPKFCAKVS